MVSVAGMHGRITGRRCKYVIASDNVGRSTRLYPKADRLCRGASVCYAGRYESKTVTVKQKVTRVGTIYGNNC